MCIIVLKCNVPLLTMPVTYLYQWLYQNWRQLQVTYADTPLVSVYLENSGYECQLIYWSIVWYYL